MPPSAITPPGGSEASVSLSEVGEFALIARVTTDRRQPASTLLGPGDDAALLAAPDGGVLLSTDVMVDGPDFRRAWSTPEELGRKAVATNLADIAAMGGVPTGLLVALTAPPDTPMALLEGIADGMAAACRWLAPGVGVVGGDLTASPVLTIAVTVAGSLQGRPPVVRSGARAGDTIAYAGTLGHAAAALRLLFAAGESAPEAVAALRRSRTALLAAQLAPEPPIHAGPIAAEVGATAMLDVSDGLLRDADRIARASRVALDLDPRAIEVEVRGVVSAAGCSKEDATSAVFSGGEDHGLLATFPGVVPAPFRRLGRVVEGRPEVRVGGRPMGDAGWDSFAAS